MAVWFSSAAVISVLADEQSLTPGQAGLLSSAVQGGFAVGAVVFAALGLADRFDPRRVFFLSAFAAAAANASLLIIPAASPLAALARALTGAALAGVYPVGMKIVAGWGVRDRGLLISLIIGALTLGSAAPHLFAFLGGADWRSTVIAASAAAAAGGAIVLAAGLGPHHARAPTFSAAALARAWTDRRIRLAYAGYLGHMWELYAFWAWLGVAIAASFANQSMTDPARMASIAAFIAIAAGSLSSVVAGFVADRIGKAEVAALAMAGSGIAACLAALTFGGSPLLFAAVVIVWGVFVIADSAQFSALVADAAPPTEAGSLMTLQTALGFALTFVTVQGTPLVADRLGWPATFCLMAVGPALGIVAMMRHRAIAGED